VRCKNVSPEGECKFRDITTAAGLLMETLMEVEEHHIRGMVYIFDVSGIDMSYMKLIPKQQNFFRLGKNTEKLATGRHKEFHFVNLSPTLKWVANLVMANTTQKMKSRARFYSSIDELDFIDKKSLPKEYGGKISMEEMFSEVQIDF
jgi:hypothetical protein